MSNVSLLFREDTPPFDWTLWNAGSSDQDQVRPTELPLLQPPVVWNSLSTHLRSTSFSREQFRDGLKTHIFRQAYAFLWELLFKIVYDIDIDIKIYFSSFLVFEHKRVLFVALSGNR